MEVRIAGADAAGMRGAERHDDFPAEIVALQEGADNLGGLPVPDRISYIVTSQLIWYTILSWIGGRYHESSHICKAVSLEGG